MTAGWVSGWELEDRGSRNKRRKYLPLLSEQGGGVSYRKLGRRGQGLCLSPIRKDNESLPDSFAWTVLSSEFTGSNSLFLSSIQKWKSLWFSFCKHAASACIVGL